MTFALNLQMLMEDKTTTENATYSINVLKKKIIEENNLFTSLISRKMFRSKENVLDEGQASLRDGFSLISLHLPFKI